MFDQNCSIPTADTILESAHIPSRGGDMIEKRNPDGSITYTYWYRYVGPDGRSKATAAKGTTAPYPTISEMVRLKKGLVDRAEKRRSLTDEDVPDWSTLVDIALRENKGGGQPWVYARIRKELAGPVDKTFAARYHEFIGELEDDERSPNSISHHKSAVRFVLNEAVRQHLLLHAPISNYKIDLKFRDRTWNSDAERNGFFSKMVELQSHLYWSCVLLERRPMRKNDLWKLTDDNLILVGEKAPYLHFFGKKTGKRTKKIRETYIPLRYIDGTPMTDLLDYLQHGRPADCPLLFPHQYGITNVLDMDSLRKCRWTPMGDPKRHWGYICDKANVDDFHIHDLKHVATSNMLNEERWSIEELLQLGIQFSETILKKCYWKKKALSALPEPCGNQQAGERKEGAV